MLKQKHKRLPHIVPDRLAGALIQLIHPLPADRLALAKEQAVGIGQMPSSKPADMDVIILDPDVAKPALFGVEGGDVFALLFFGVVADADFEVVAHL